MSHIEIGQADGKPVRLDVPTLVETRLLVQAMSGGGKSWTLRRLLEQTHGQVQHIVLDPEGEFASLRERFDYVLIGKGGDRAAKPQEAGALARSVLELQCNVICDLYELKVQERRQFMRLFLEALVNAPKALWHPALVVVDEAHAFCPEGAEAESSNAVIDLLSRGRKRGFAAVLATQRLAKLDKNAAAECGNVMVGRTVQDVDRKRALEMLAVVRSEHRDMNSALMTLPAGSFYSVGGAFRPQTLTFFRVGSVQTQHPAIGRGQMVAPTPPPSGRIQAVLAKLDHISRDVDEELHERETLRAKVGDLQREVKRLERELATEQQRDTGIPERALQQRDAEWRAKFDAIANELDRRRVDLEDVASTISQLLARPLAMEVLPALSTGMQTAPKRAIDRQKLPLRAIGSPRATPVGPADNGDYRPRAGARRMLEALARYHQGVMTAAQLRTMARLRKSGTSGTYLRELRHHGLVEGDDDALRITQAGLDMVGMAAAQPLTAEEILDHWRERFRAGARRMLDALVDDRGRGMTREQLGEIADLEPSSGTFGTYLGELRRNGLAVERGGMIYLAEELR